MFVVQSDVDPLLLPLSESHPSYHTLKQPVLAEDQPHTHTLSPPWPHNSVCLNEAMSLAVGFMVGLSFCCTGRVLSALDEALNNRETHLTHLKSNDFFFSFQYILPHLADLIISTYPVLGYVRAYPSCHIMGGRLHHALVTTLLQLLHCRHRSSNSCSSVVLNILLHFVPITREGL